ncbi:hypothetical protein LSAT2_008232 [Lamellibrachia satsuma]|nr:hypothetical protein LSAT2_008232 [Lamellibrachia satsuma]
MQPVPHLTTAIYRKARHEPSDTARVWLTNEPCLPSLRPSRGARQRNATANPRITADATSGARHWTRERRELKYPTPDTLHRPISALS